MLDGYILERKIGEGQHSVVKLASHEKDKYAIKVIAKDRIRSVDGLLRLERELSALVTLNDHPNIVKFKEALHSETSLYLVMEHLPMDMFTFMDNFKAGEALYRFYDCYCRYILLSILLLSLSLSLLLSLSLSLSLSLLLLSLLLLLPFILVLCCFLFCFVSSIRIYDWFENNPPIMYLKIWMTILPQ